jgi:hypothetical protein
MSEQELAAHCQRATALIEILSQRCAAAPTLVEHCRDFREAFEDMVSRYLSLLAEKDSTETLHRLLAEMRVLLTDETSRREMAERASLQYRIEVESLLNKLFATQAAGSESLSEVLAYVQRLELENATLRRLVAPLPALQ